MVKVNKTMNKVWVFSVAAALIAGSGVTMNFILSNKTFAETGKQVIEYQPDPLQKTVETPGKTEAKAEYTVIDQSKSFTKDELMDSPKVKGLSPEAKEQWVDGIQSTYIPGDKDLSAEQAAAYGAAVLKKSFAANLSGYTARAMFLGGSLPGTDTWTISFDPASSSGQPNGSTTAAAKSFNVYMNAVSGTIMNASAFDGSSVSTPKKADVNDPAWRETAEQAVAVLLPKNISIVNSKVVSSQSPNFGVPVLCELSNGTAYVVGISGESKDVVNLYFFQDGYDGSLENSINKQKGMK
ncbi:hypothetical protein ACFQI7_25115 [Paenibacillus allorhizosphaerae]|uniref:PepSY domain-containing protein n=1 Tax=Paenibacillus allorhizosphaerae TaxID=2849866 RepID=A0ABM8VJ40_9BACL|nr:hypothetical protein [Paenibacillus allorhizosphaerae]CAG7644975.1 hypothetical protein PAECIP111802_03399 [Paenibacillus allorhizosphaerae]